MIRVIKVHPRVLTISCRFCEKAPCVAGCPEEALKVDETNKVVVDKDKCTGCSWCFTLCDFGAITMDPEEKVVRICDLCDGDPECVKACPEKALELTTDEAMASKARQLVAEKFMKEVLALARW
jgi:Fe-S-cluster-containing hydrogenase component 2